METFRILKADKWMFNENRARCCKERDKRISDCLFPQSRSRFAVDTQRSDFWFTATVWGCSKRHGTPCAALCIYFIIVFNSFWLDPFCERFPLLLERVDSLLKAAIVLCSARSVNVMGSLVLSWSFVLLLRLSVEKTETKDQNLAKFCWIFPKFHHFFFGIFPKCSIFPERFNFGC